MIASRHQAVFWLVVSSAACAADEGSFRIELDLPPGASLRGSEIRLRLVDSLDLTSLADAPSLRETPWIPFGDRLDIDTVPADQSLVAVVEARQAEGIIAYGFSEPFGLQPDRAVSARVQLRLVPRGDGGSVIQLDEPVLTNRARRALRLAASRAVRFQLSGVAEFVPFRSVGSEAGDDCASTPVGLECKASFDVSGCVAGSASCARRIFARAVDEHGYASAPEEVEVVLDPRPPRILRERTGIALIPPTGSLRDSVSSLTEGARAIVVVETDERVRRETATLAAPANDALRFAIAQVSGAATRLRFEAVVSGAVPEGAYCDLEVSVSDVAGNRVTESLDVNDETCRLTVDRTPPPAGELPLTLVRAPGGLDATNLEPRTWVETTVPLPPGHLVFVEPLGQVPVLLDPGSDRLLDVQDGALPGATSLELVARLVDASGNVGPPVPLLRQRLIAVPGSEDSLAVYEAPRTTWHLFPDGASPGKTVSPADARVLAVSGAPGMRVSTSTQARLWQRWRTLPPRRDGMALGVDRVRGVLALQGGYAATPLDDGSTNPVTDQIWELEGRAVRQIDLRDRSQTSAAANHWFVFDGTSGALLFPDTDEQVSRRLWQWTGRELVLRSFAEVEFSPTLPGAYDPKRGELMVTVTTGVEEEYGLVSWDGSSWRTLYEFDTSTHPATVPNSCAAWSPELDGMVVFGGRVVGQQPNDRMILLRRDGPLFPEPAIERPPGRLGCEMVYDEARKEVWLFGGLDHDVSLYRSAFNDLYRLDLFEDRSLGQLVDRWELMTPSSPKRPPARSLGGSTYHPGLERMIIQGGFPDWDESLKDIWSWDGDRWWRHTPQVVGTRRRFEHAVAVDDDGRLVTHGGNGGSRKTSVGEYQPRGDTSVFTGGRWVRGPDGGPGVATGHAMVYDPTTGRAVLYGRVRDELGFEAQTWVWQADAWRRLAGPQPPVRSEHAMAYDPVGQRPMLFGGRSVTGELFSDTWVLDGDTWSLVTSSTVPPARASHGMARLGSSGVVMFGGGDPDTWFWDGTSWSTLEVAGRPPPGPVAMAPLWAKGEVVLTATTEASLTTWLFNGSQWTVARPSSAPTLDVLGELAPDPTGQGVWLFGGGIESIQFIAARDATWRFDGSDWTDFTEPPLAPPAAQMVAAYDADDGVTILFGGENAETWMYESLNWVDAAEFGPRPSARSGHAMAYDPAAGRILLFGGERPDGTFDAEVWGYDEAEGWSAVAAPGTAPTPRADAAWAQHPEGTVLFGGRAPGELGDTWTFDGESWTARGDAGPSARWGSGAAYLPGIDAVVLFGGTNAGGAAFDDTWLWDGRTWTASSATGPQARSGPGLVYDEARRRLVLTGGRDASGDVLADAWTFDGSVWESLDVRDLPARAHAAVAYHAKSDELVVYGGEAGPRDSAAWSDQTVTLPGAALDRPGIVLELDWKRLGIDARGIDAVELEVVAGGLGFEADGAPRAGFEVLAWHAREGRWTSLGTDEASALEPASLVLTSTGAATHDITYDPLTIMLRPLSGRNAGPEEAQVALDRASVTIDYTKAP